MTKESMPEPTNPPVEGVLHTRDAFRRQRRYRRRRRYVGALFVIGGLALTGTGVALYFADDSTAPVVPTNVEPTSVERTTTTVAP